MSLFNESGLKSKLLNFEDKENNDSLSFSVDETKIIMAEDINRIKESINYSINSLLNVNKEFDKILDDINTVSSTIIQYEGLTTEISSQINTINNKLTNLFSNIMSSYVLKEQLDELTISGRNINSKIIKINDDFNQLSKEYSNLKNINNNYEMFVDKKLQNFEKIINEKLIDNNIDFSNLDNDYEHNALQIENKLSNTSLTVSNINDLLLSAETLNLNDINNLNNFLNQIQELGENI